MVASVEAGFSTSKDKEKLHSETEATKIGSSTGTSTGTTNQSTTGSNTQTTSGSVNTSEILGESSQTTSGRTDISNITGTTGSTTSGSTNITSTDASQNTSVTSGSKNQTTNSGSVNQTVNSGSRNVTTQGPSSSLTTISDRVNTSQLMLTQEAVDYMVKGILEGPQGLAGIATGKNISGIYNDTSTTQLTSDLVARTAGEVASRGAMTRQVIGGGTVLTENSAIETVQLIGGSTSTQTIGGSTSTTDVGGSTTTQNIGATKGIQQIGGSTTSGFTNQTQTSQIGASTTTGTTSQKGTQNIGASTTTGTSASSSTGTSSQINASQTLDEAYSKTDSEALKEGQKAEVKAKGGWIVCTELYAQGRMDRRVYLTGLKAFQQYDEKDTRGYYIWAVPCVLHLQKNPNSALSKFLEVGMNARAEYLFACAYPSKGKKTVGGWVATHVGWAICKILARTIARNYTNQHPEDSALDNALKGKNHVR